MGKKNSTRKKTQAEDSRVVEKSKPSSITEKQSNEIDEIFLGKKRKKPAQLKADRADETETKKSRGKSKKRKIKEEEEGRFTDPPTRPRQKTEDGLAIFTEEELNFNNANAGGTPLCPFDCDCCF